MEKKSSTVSSIAFEMANFEFPNYFVVYMFLAYQLGDDDYFS